MSMPAWAANPQIQQGSSATFPYTSSSSATGSGWTITLNGTVVAAGGVPTSFGNVSFSSGQFTVSINTTTQIAAGYQVNCYSSGTLYQASFDVIARATLSSLALSPNAVTVGTNSTGTVTLSTAAPSGGAAVTLTSGNTAVATVPASITVAAGATTANFTVTSQTVTTTATATITATLMGVAKTAVLTVKPLQLSTLSLNGASLIGGQTTTGTVTLTDKAPSSGAVFVNLSSSNAAAASVQTQVGIASGTTSMTFTVTAHPVTAPTAVTITASYGGIAKTASLTVNPVMISSITLDVSGVAGGKAGPVIGTATLNAPAPAGGVVVTLACNNNNVIVPASVEIDSGQTSNTFSAAAFSVEAATDVVITGTYNGNTSAQVTLSPASGGGAGASVYLEWIKDHTTSDPVYEQASSGATIGGVTSYPRMKMNGGSLTYYPLPTTVEYGLIAERGLSVLSGYRADKVTFCLHEDAGHLPDVSWDVSCDQLPAGNYDPMNPPNPADYYILSVRPGGFPMLNLHNGDYTLTTTIQYHWQDDIECGEDWYDLDGRFLIWDYLYTDTKSGSTQTAGLTTKLTIQNLLITETQPAISAPICWDPDTMVSSSVTATVQTACKANGTATLLLYDAQMNRCAEITKPVVFDGTTTVTFDWDGTGQGTSTTTPQPKGLYFYNIRVHADLFDMCYNDAAIDFGKNIVASGDADQIRSQSRSDGTTVGDYLEFGNPAPSYQIQTEDLATQSVSLAFNLLGDPQHQTPPAACQIDVFDTANLQNISSTAATAVLGDNTVNVSFPIPNHPTPEGQDETENVVLAISPQDNFSNRDRGHRNRYLMPASLGESIGYPLSSQLD